MKEKGIRMTEERKLMATAILAKIILIILIILGFGYNIDIALNISLFIIWTIFTATILMILLILITKAIPKISERIVPLKYLIPYYILVISILISYGYIFTAIAYTFTALINESFFQIKQDRPVA